MFSTEAPLHYSKVALLDPVDGQVDHVACRSDTGRLPTKVRIERLDGMKVRVSKRSDRVIPKPIHTRSDFKTRDDYKGAYTAVPAPLTPRRGQQGHSCRRGRQADVRAVDAVVRAGGAQVAEPGGTGCGVRRTADRRRSIRTRASRDVCVGIAPH